MAVKPLPSLEYLNQCFVYDAVNGTLTWKVRPREHFNSDQNWKRWNAIYSNNVAGYLNVSGYFHVKIKVELKTHRIAWAIHNNQDIPDGFGVDHIDGDTANNRADNLRLSTHGQNKSNSKTPKNSSTGFKGVTIGKRCTKKKYIAQIMRLVNGKRVCKKLGYFNTPEEAHAAYVDAAKKYFGDFARAS